MTKAKVKLSQFKPQAANANKHTERGIALLDKSIRQDGWIGAVTVAADGETFDGSARLERVADVMAEQEPIVVETDGTRPIIIKRTDIPDAQDKRAKRLAVAANAIASADWNPDGDLLAALSAEDEYIAQLVKNDDRAAKAMLEAERNAGGGQDAEPQIDRAAELNKKWQVKTGDLWRIGEHYLLCGDSTKRDNVEKVIGGVNIALNFSDPPYGIERDEGFEGFGGFGTPIARRQYTDEWDSERPTKEQFDFMLSCADNSIIWGGNFFADLLPKSTHWIVWDKNNTMPTFGDCELAWTSFDRKSVKKFEITYNGLIGKEKERFHPTQKPLSLYIACLSEYSKEGDTIIDFYAGSGTTILACENTKRIGHALEAIDKFCAVILQRMSDAFPGIEIERIE